MSVCMSVFLPAGCLRAHKAVPRVDSWCKCSLSSQGRCTRPAPTWRCASSCQWFSACRSTKDLDKRHEETRVTTGRRLRQMLNDMRCLIIVLMLVAADVSCVHSQATICRCLRCEASRLRPASRPSCLGLWGSPWTRLVPSHKPGWKVRKAENGETCALCLLYKHSFKSMTS